MGCGVANDLGAEVLVVGRGDTALRNGSLFLRGAHLADVGELRFAGRHNYENALFAAAAAQRLGAAPSDIREALLAYEARPHRVQVVAEVAGVTYVDDSKATNPAAVVAALESFEAPVVLIVGGSEKFTDFSELLPVLRGCRAVVCQGESGPRIAAYLEGRRVGRRGPQGTRPRGGSPECRGVGKARRRRPALARVRELRPVLGVRREGRGVYQVRAGTRF